tara:strand:- start:1462 stop:1689 length:228 start_codon:yes stop_codon:yes gene_type:complete
MMVTFHFSSEEPRMIGKTASFTLVSNTQDEGILIKAKIKERIKKCKQHPRGAVIAEDSECTYTFNNSSLVGVKLK